MPTPPPLLPSHSSDVVPTQSAPAFNPRPAHGAAMRRSSSGSMNGNGSTWDKLLHEGQGQGPSDGVEKGESVSGHVVTLMIAWEALFH